MWLLTFLIQNWKAISVAALIAASNIAAYNRGADSIQAKWVAEKAQISQELLANALEAQKRQTTKEREYNENIETITRMRDTYKRDWLRLQKTPCPGKLPNADTASNSELTVTWELQPELPSSAEQAINEFDAAYYGESLRADKVVEECRKVVELKKPQGD